MRRWLTGLAKALGLVLGAAVLAITALLWWPIADPPTPQRHDATLFDGAQIVDVARGTLTEPQQILVQRGRITDMAPRLATLPPRTRRINARGRFLMPGLWDMHSHSWQVSPQLHLPLQLASGVTAVRDMMGCAEASDPLLACHADKARWSAEAVAGTRAGPRFVGDASFFYDDAALSPAAVAARVAADKASGATLLKVYNRLSLPAYRALTDAGRRAGMPVVGHLPKAVPLAEAVATGQRSFEHGRIFIEGCFAGAADWRAGKLDSLPRPQLLRRMLANRDAAGCARTMAAMASMGAAFVPTLVTREEDARAHEAAFMNDARLALADPLSRWAYRDDAAGTTQLYASAADRALLAAALKQAQVDTQAAYRAGVPVLVGSDTIIAGPRLHDEMALLVAAGLTPAEVLRAATLDAARFMGLADDLGSVAVGKRADLVLLTANPLTDIRMTRRIEGVMLNGHWHDPRALTAYVRGQAGHWGNMARMIWGFVTSPASATL